MNLFQKYGIKEVADVVFYSINTIGDEEYYTPVLYLDTLKVSTLEKSSEKVSANGGYGNKKLISWNFGKEITLNLEDALFTPASMSLMWGGKLDSKFTKYTSAIVKINMANKYGSLHYSTKAYPSPALSDDEWEIIYQACDDTLHDGSNAVTLVMDTNNHTKVCFTKNPYTKNVKYIEENRTLLRKAYYQRNFDKVFIESNNRYSGSNTLKAWYSGVSTLNLAIPEVIVERIIQMLNSINKIGTIETSLYDVEVVDRMERCVVKDKCGLIISTQEQKENLLKYYRNDEDSSYVIYYDAKTMLPLLSIDENGMIAGWDDVPAQQNSSKNFVTGNGTFKLRIGTPYLKWSRTVKRKSGTDDGIIGKTLVINTDTFPDTYKIVGETYIREQKTGKDQRYQFTIHRAQVSSDTNITLEAEGEPTTFSMSVEVLSPPNDIMMELKQYDVDEDTVHGGMRIVPQRSRYSYTPTTLESKTEIAFDNNEIY